MTALPAFADFPSAQWRQDIGADDWAAFLDAWNLLAEAHLSLSEGDFTRFSVKDDSLSSFLLSFTRETATAGPNSLGSSPAASSLLKATFFLASRTLKSRYPPSWALQWEFLSDLVRVHGRKRVGRVLSSIPRSTVDIIETSLQGTKKFLIKNLDEGINGDLKAVEQRLGRLNFLISASPDAAAFFLAGDDFVDGLISCFMVMNPPLRKVIVANLYLCLIGLVEGEDRKSVV